MKLTKLELRNFHGIRDLTLDFDPRLTVLAGVNGSGKSSILCALRIAMANCRDEPAGDLNDLSAHFNNSIEYGKGKGFLFRCCFDDGIRISRASESEYSVKLEEKGKLKHVGPFPLFLSYPVTRMVSAVSTVTPKVKLSGAEEAIRNSLNATTDFQEFFDWYCARENYENEQFRDAILESQKHIFRDKQLDIVGKVIASFTGFEKLRVRRLADNEARFEVVKQGESLFIDQLSDGEKGLLALVGDLARRLALANPELDDPLQGEAIVLIDEIDLHLHPKWQRMVAPKLLEVFPNCQFVITTHSPQVLGEVDAKHLRCLYLDPKDGVKSSTPTQSLGLSSGDILERLMEADTMDKSTDDRLTEIFAAIDDERFSEAKAKIKTLEKDRHGILPETIRATTMINMLE